MSTKEELESKLEELVGLRKLHTEIQDHLDRVNSAKIEEVRHLLDQIDDMNDRIAHLRVEMEEVEPEVIADRTALRQQIQQLELHIKQTSYALPSSILREGTKVKVGPLSVTVSKTQFEVTYDLVALLRDEPELFDRLSGIEIDGDPIIINSVDAAVLERAVESGLVDKERVEPFRIETKKKNPSVSIKEMT